jgi:catechol 2,3-dioxygenase-like lactoylglutathione lyase family enzyme
MVPGAIIEESSVATPNFVLLYVENPAASAAFYQRLLGRPALESSPTFAMFALHEGTMLGLWWRHTAEPAPTGTGGGGEIGFTVESEEAVRALHAEWTAKGLPVLQPPTRMDFGFTFVAADPDGHRLRVFVPAGA